MLIFLYGSDSYRRQKKQEWVIAEYRKKHSGLSIERFDLEEEGGFERLTEFVKNQSLFDPYKLAVVRGVHTIVAEKERVAWLKSIQGAEDVVFLLVADAKPPKALAFLLEKPTKCDEFQPLYGVPFQRFVEHEARARGARLPEKELANLATLYRDDMWGLMTELNKLDLLSDSRFMIQDSRFKRDFFELAKEVAYGRGGRALCALEELLVLEDHAKTFNMLAALVSGAQKIRMADYDAAIKAGSLDYEAALTDCIL